MNTISLGEALTRAGAAFAIFAASGLAFVRACPKCGHAWTLFSPTNGARPYMWCRHKTGTAFI
eukprot:1327199-Amphidinium_carterae.1